MTTDKWVVLLLRIGVFLTFLGHGINAILIKPNWIHLITSFGVSTNFAIHAMPIIGVIDVLVAFSILIYPIPKVIIWAVFWAFITALSRPLSGEPILEFIERGSNWIVPLVLFMLIKQNRSVEIVKQKIEI